MSDTVIIFEIYPFVVVVFTCDENKGGMLKNQELQWKEGTSTACKNGNFNERKALLLYEETETSMERRQFHRMKEQKLQLKEDT